MFCFLFKILKNTTRLLEAEGVSVFRGFWINFIFLRYFRINFFIFFHFYLRDFQNIYYLLIIEIWDLKLFVFYSQSNIIYHTLVSRN